MLSSIPFFVSKYMRDEKEYATYIARQIITPPRENQVERIEQTKSKPRAICVKRDGKEFVIRTNSVTYLEPGLEHTLVTKNLIPKA